MSEYSGLFRKMLVNASGMDFTLKCRHFPNPVYGTPLHSTDSLPILMVLNNRLLAPSLYLWCSQPIPLVIYYLPMPPAYPFGTQLSSTGPLPTPMVLSVFYWPTAYLYGTLLTSTGSLPFPMVYYFLLLANCLSPWYSTIFYRPTAHTTVLYYHLLALCLSLSYFTTFYWPHCLYLWYSSIFYWLPAYPYSSILPSNGSLPMLCYSTIFVWSTAYTSYGTLLSSTGSQPILMILYYLLLAHCLYLW